MKTKKNWKSFAAGMLTMALFLLFTLCSCKQSGANGKIEQNSYSSFFDRFEMEWFLNQNYGEDSIREYYYYEIPYDDVSILLAQRMTDDASKPEYLAQIYLTGMGDWYSYRDDGLGKIYILDPTVADVILDDSSKLTQLNISIESIRETKMLFTKKSNGLIDKFALSTESVEYEVWEIQYDANNQISKVVNINSGYGNINNRVFSNDSKNNYESFIYQYNADGTLKECTWKYNNEERIYATVDFFYDANGNRTEIKSNGSYSGKENMTYDRNENGRIKTIHYSDIDNGWSILYMFQYLEDGAIVIETA